MKITKRQLRRIIKEEKAKVLKEMRPGVGQDELVDGVHDGALMDLDDYNSLARQIERVIGQFVGMGYTREDVSYALQGILEEI